MERIKEPDPFPDFDDAPDGPQESPLYREANERLRRAAREGWHKRKDILGKLPEGEEDGGDGIERIAENEFSFIHVYRP